MPRMWRCMGLCREEQYHLVVLEAVRKLDREAAWNHPSPWLQLADHAEQGGLRAAVFRLAIISGTKYWGESQQASRTWHLQWGKWMSLDVVGKSRHQGSQTEKQPGLTPALDSHRPRPWRHYWLRGLCRCLATACRLFHLCELQRGTGQLSSPRSPPVSQSQSTGQCCEAQGKLSKSVLLLIEREGA